MAKLLNLQEWAAEVYDSAIPFYSASMDAGGATYPAPELHGKEYKVQPDAIYVDPRKKNLRAKPKHTKLPSGGTLLERLTHGEKASTLRR